MICFIMYGDKEKIRPFNYAFVEDVKPKNRVDIETALLTSRIIYFNGSVNFQTCAQVIKCLLLLSKESNEEIQLFINTYGGSINDALSVVNIINQIPCDVRTIGVGQIYSAGVIMIISGTKNKRGCLPDTDFLIHQPSVSFNKETTLNLLDIQIRTKELEKANNRVIDLYLERTKLNKKVALELSKKDSFFDAETALKYGLVDYIVSKDDKKK
jgi:ATP-dependent Clp protease, protease subunit